MTRCGLLACGLSFVLGACSSSNDGSASSMQPDATVTAELPQWHTVFADLDSLVLAGWAASDDEAFFVGSEGKVLRYRDEQWFALEVPSRATLWWVWGTANDDVYVGGEEGTLLHFNGATWSALDVGLSATQTIWGIWGATGSDIWVVGGNARSNGPGFVLHGDGRHFERQDVGEVPNLFKVWGRARDDVHVVGDHGLMMHFDGDGFETTHLDPDADGGRVESLFTVAGNAAGDWVAVGGVSSALLFEKTRSENTDTQWVFRDMHSFGLNGVAVAAWGDAYAVGLQGAIRHRVGGEWLNEDHESDRHYHSAVLMGEMAFAVGGDLLSPKDERRGLIAAKGEVAGGTITWVPMGDAGGDSGRFDAGPVRPVVPDAGGPDLGHLPERDSGSPPAEPADSGRPPEDGASHAGFDASAPEGSPSGLCTAELACNAPAECWYIQGQEEDRCVTPCASASECPPEFGPNPQCAAPGCQTLYTVCMPAHWRGCF